MLMSDEVEWLKERIVQKDTEKRAHVEEDKWRQERMEIYEKENNDLKARIDEMESS